MTKQLDQSDLELQLIYWTKKKDQNVKESMDNFGKNPIKDLKLQNKRREYWDEINNLRDLINSKKTEIPERIERFGRTYVLEKK